MRRYLLYHQCQQCRALDIFTFFAEEPISKEMHVRHMPVPVPQTMAVTDGSEEETVSETPSETPVLPASRTILLRDF
jgi:hypothetical protein